MPRLPPFPIRLIAGTQISGERGRGSHTDSSEMDVPNKRPSGVRCSVLIQIVEVIGSYESRGVARGHVSSRAFVHGEGDGRSESAGRVIFYKKERHVTWTRCNWETTRKGTGWNCARRQRTYGVTYLTEIVNRSSRSGWGERWWAEEDQRFRE